MFHGNGGYDWDTVYNMPLWLRKTTFNLIKEHYDKQNLQNKQKELTGNKKEILKPNVPNPDYITKATKK